MCCTRARSPAARSAALTNRAATSFSEPNTGAALA